MCMMSNHHRPTPKGFKPSRAEPNGFLVHHLNHSVTLSMEDVEQLCQDAFSMLGVRSCARARPTWRAPPAQSLPRQCHWPRVLQLAAGKPSFLLLSSKATLETGSYLLYCGPLASLRGTPRSDSEGIRTLAGKAQWISSPSPQPLGHAVCAQMSNACAQRQDGTSRAYKERAHPDLNQGPADLRSAALTTELCAHLS